MDTKNKLEEIKRFVNQFEDDDNLFRNLNLLEEDIIRLRYLMHLDSAKSVVDSWPKWKQEYCRQEYKK